MKPKRGRPPRRRTQEQKLDDILSLRERKEGSRAFVSAKEAAAAMGLGAEAQSKVFMAATRIDALRAGGEPEPGVSTWDSLSEQAVEEILNIEAKEELEYKEVDYALRNDKTKGPSNQVISKAYRRIAASEAVARCIFSGMTVGEICRAVHFSPKTLLTLMRSNVFRQVFKRVKSQIYEPVDNALKNEYLAFSERITNAAQRALTTLASISNGEHQGGDRTQAMHVANMVNAAKIILSAHPETAPVKREANKAAHITVLDSESARNLARALSVVPKQEDFIDVPLIEEPRPEQDQDDDDRSYPSA
jgi:hypothetical protein